jgi:hypothetical protein
MASKRPRVIGLDELLNLRAPLREKPAPLVYLSDKESARRRSLIDARARAATVPLVAPARAPSPRAPYALVPGWVSRDCAIPPGATTR